MERQEILDSLNFDDLEILSGWQTYDVNGQTMLCDIKFPSLREDILYAIADAYEENGKHYYDDEYKNQIISMDPYICIKMHFDGEVKYNLCVSINGENDYYGEFNEGVDIGLEGKAKERFTERLSEITGVIPPLAVGTLFEKMYQGVEEKVGMPYEEYRQKIQHFGEKNKDDKDFANALKTVYDFERKTRFNSNFSVLETICQWAAKEMGMPYDEFFKTACSEIEKAQSLRREVKHTALTISKQVKCDFDGKDKPDKGVDRD